METILILLSLALLALIGAGTYFVRSEFRMVDSETTKWSNRVADLMQENRDLREELKQKNDQLVHHLVLLRKDGFAPVPMDDPFETYRITDEHEAEIESQRMGEE